MSMIDHVSTVPSEPILATKAQKIEVQSAYVALLGRPADPEGLDFWSTQLALGHPIPTITQGIIQSVEYQIRQMLQHIIDNVFNNIFGRDPDQAGREFYLQKQQEEGLSDAQLVQHIISGAKGLDAENKQAKVDAAQKMTEKLQEQMEQIEQNHLGAQQKVQQNAMDRMKEMLKEVNQETSPDLTEEEINQIVKEANESIQPDPITIEVPGPTKYVEVPGEVALSLGDDEDEVELGTVAADIAISINGAFGTAVLIDPADFDAIEAALDVIGGFSSDDRVSLDPSLSDTPVVNLLPNDFKSAYLLAGLATDESDEPPAAYVFAEDETSDDAWLFLSEAGEITNAVKLVGGPAEFTDSNILPL